MDYKWVALSVTTVGMFMASLDSCIVVVGLPTILQDLHASIVHGIWIITGYILMTTILAVILGRLADLLRENDLATVHVLSKRYADLDRARPFVASIIITPIARTQS